MLYLSQVAQDVMFIGYTYVPAVHLNFGKQSLYYHGTTIWNSLPASVIETDSLNSFKHPYLKYV